MGFLIDSILLEDDVNAYPNPTLAQVKTLAKLAPSWTPIVNAEFADSTAHAAAARAGFGVASPELTKSTAIVADCATNPTGPMFAPPPHCRDSGQSAVERRRRGDGSDAAAPPARAVGAAGAPAQPASLCDESRGGYAEVHDGRGARDRGRCS